MNEKKFYVHTDFTKNLIQGPLITRSDTE